MTRRPRPATADVLLTRLGLLADDPIVVAACAATAVAALAGESAHSAAHVGHQAIALLDGAARPAPVGLLQAVAEADVTAGHGETADGLFRRAADGYDSDSVESAALALAQGRRRAVTGDLAGAQALFEQAASILAAVNDDRGVAIARGRIADILYQRGELDEALRIRRTEQLPVYERLGDVRSRAVTWGQIADILYQRGEGLVRARSRAERSNWNEGSSDDLLDYCMVVAICDDRWGHCVSKPKPKNGVRRGCSWSEK